MLFRSITAIAPEIAAAIPPHTASSRVKAASKPFIVFPCAIAGVPALAAIAAFYVLPARFRFIFYWVAIVLLNAAATAAGHFLAWNPYVGIGLPLSLVVPALVLAAIALLGRRSLRRRPRPG